MKDWKQSKTYQNILVEEESLMHELKRYPLESYMWNKCWDQLDRVRSNKVRYEDTCKANEQKPTKQTSCIYVNVGGNVAHGYVDWYWYNYEYYINNMYVNTLSPEVLLQLKCLAEREAWHFANRIKQHHQFSIPAKVLMYKLKGFIHELMVQLTTPPQEYEQLEFNFE